MSWPGSKHVASIAAALVVVTWAAFSGVLHGAFVAYDDGVYVAANEHVTNGISRGAVSWALTATENSNWHPVTWISPYLDVELYGLDAGKHHRTNLLIHTANVLLIFFCSRA